MRQHERWVLVVVALAAFGGHAHAQKAYVGASAVTDVVRSSGLRSGTAPDASGEAIGAAIRVGTAIGARWGIDLEFVNTGDIESDLSVNILATQQALTSAGLTFTSISTEGTTGTTIIPTIFPSPRYTAERQTSTLSAMVWAQQQAGSRTSIAYLGGVAFTRTTREDHLELSVRTTLPGIPVLPPPVTRIDNKYVFYGAGAIVGTDVHVRMTDHVRLVPGVRLQMLNVEGQNGLIVRPAVGLQWLF